MEWLSSPEAWAAFITLVIMEIILGIDNIIFISIQTSKLPVHQQKKGRILGLAFALLTRIILLLSITWVMTLTTPLFNVADWLGIEGEWHERLSISGRDLILFFGGLFLLYKSIHEIHDSMEGSSSHGVTKSLSFVQTIIQIGLLDIVFGLDSVITAVGMADDVQIMIAAVVISMIFMIFTVNGISDFVNKHPSIKMLALSFLLLIGITLVAESVEQPIAKGYIYFAMGFSIFVEFMVIRMNKGKGKGKPVDLETPDLETNPSS
jgi:predicted tellurium resistance membrane protein TerC